MKLFKDVVDEIRIIFLEINLFKVILDSIIVFLASYLVLSFFRFYGSALLISFFCAVVAFFVLFYAYSKKKPYREIESKYPEINEKLRTAVDNMQRENFIVNELQAEVILNIKNVRTSSFIPLDKVSYKILTSIIISFLILIIVVAGIGFDLGNFAKNSKIYKYLIEPGANIGGTGGGDVRTAGGGRGTIFGNDTSIAELGKSEVKMAIKPVGYEISLRNMGSPERRDFSESFPTEIFGEASESYQEQTLTKEEYDLAKQYFLKIAKT